MGGQPSAQTPWRVRWTPATPPQATPAAAAPAAVAGGHRAAEAECPAADPVLQLSQVSFQRGETTVLDRVSLTIRPGEWVGLVGPNGSGKTTLLRIVLGLQRPAFGDVRLFGQPLASFRQWWRVGYVPQRPASGVQGFPATVREVVATGITGPAGGAGRGGRTGPQAVRQVLQWLGLEPLAHRPIGRLSGGQQQRVFLARALVGQPDLLVLDEPLDGVDPATQERFLALLDRLRRERGLTVLWVSHDLGAVCSRATTLVGLNRRLVFQGPPEQFGPEEMARLYGFPVTLTRHRR